MTEEQPQQSTAYPVRRRSAAVENIANTLELLVTALILAFVFRAFVVEAFRIPTGSMAETLRGSHYHLRCIRCGCPYDVGGDSWTVPKPRCPSCGYVLPPGMAVSVSNGDRILVLKCLYQFLPAKRWDVIVFKNPIDPRENYIKRLIGLPGETVEIIDGDIYINGLIARKPPKVQQELWMPVYDNDFQSLRRGRVLPAGDNGPDDRASVWRQPFKNDPNSTWNLNAKGPTVFALAGPPDRLQWLLYDDRIGNDFRASYAYNDGSEHYQQPICSDLMIRFDVTNGAPEGVIGAVLAKYGVEYRATADLAGRLVISKRENGIDSELVRSDIPPVSPGTRHFQFANVDHQLVLSLGDRTVRHDLGTGRAVAGGRSRRAGPAAKIFGAGALTLWHIGLYRDIHYINERILRAAEGDPFTLGPDEYFACGDNSPCSLDGRLWATEGIGNHGPQYSAGVVPKDYLMGKAFFVYWSDAFRLFGNPLPIVPNVGGMQFIYGGSEERF